MNEGIVYESETDDTRIMLSRIGAFVNFVIIIGLESWLWKVTSIGPVFFFLLLSSVVLAFLGTPLFYLIRYASLARPRLVIFWDKLWVGEKEIAFNEIENIILINDKPSFSKWSWPEESLTIKLKSGMDITVLVSRYSNGNLFRTICEKIKANIAVGRFEVANVTPSNVVLNPVSVDQPGNENFNEFRPSLLTSLLFYYTMMLLVVTILMLSKPMKGSDYSVNLFFAALFFALFLITWVFQKYFLVSDKYFVIKYYFFFWITTVFLIDDIRKVEILRAGRSAKLSVTTKDYRIHNFFIDPGISLDKIDEIIELVKQYAGIKESGE